MQPEASCGPSRRYCGPAPPFDTATGQFGEAAWSYRFPARLSCELLLRQENQPRSIRDIVWKGASPVVCALSQAHPGRQTGQCCHHCDARLLRQLALGRSGAADAVCPPVFAMINRQQ